MSGDAEMRAAMLEVAAEKHARCDYRGGLQGIRCCEPTGHEGPHLYKCCGPSCPGLPWIASNTPHPTSCAREPTGGVL